MAAGEGTQGLHYYVLTIFTKSRTIDDLKDLRSAIVNASKAPISIIFIGVGGGKYEEFQNLAGSRKNIVVSGQSPGRDFVEV